MSTFHRVCTQEELPPGKAREFTVAGRVLALFNVEGHFYCLDGICPHSGGPLGKGKLEGCWITCPWHGWRFDVRLGTHALTENIRQQTYQVEIRKGDVYVDLPEPE